MTFKKGTIYKHLQAPYDDKQPEFDCVMPYFDDNGVYVIVDCYIVDQYGNNAEGIVTAVPIRVEEIGEEVGVNNG